MASAIGSLAAPVWALAYTMPSSEFSSFGAVVAPEVKDTIGPVAQGFGPVKTVGSKPNTSVDTARGPEPGWGQWRTLVSVLVPTPAWAHVVTAVEVAGFQ